MRVICRKCGFREGTMDTTIHELDEKGWKEISIKPVKIDGKFYYEALCPKCASAMTGEEPNKKLTVKDMPCNTCARCGEECSMTPEKFYNEVYLKTGSIECFEWLPHFYIAKPKTNWEGDGWR